MAGLPSKLREHGIAQVPTTGASTLAGVMGACSASCWLPLVQGLLHYIPESRTLAAQRPFLNCSMDAASIRAAQAACFAARGQLRPSLETPVVVDIDAASDAPVLFKTPDGQRTWRGERAKCAMLAGRLPQPVREYINRSAFLRQSAAELGRIGLQTWDEAEMKRTGHVRSKLGSRAAGGNGWGSGWPGVVGRI